MPWALASLMAADTTLFVDGDDNVTRSYWQLLAVTGSYWQLLAVIGSYWQLLARMYIGAPARPPAPTSLLAC